MFAYKTNSADYLDYLASVMTREEILADPEKCFLLENEYIKDNMEIALRWEAAKLGSFEDKYEFVEYLICNGTELDADTILHYREKCATDPVYMDIGYGYFSDGETIKQIRKEKYKKDTDDCFNNPCMYLGRFSAVMGSIGDVKATYSPFNIISDWCNSCSNEDKAKATFGKLLQQGIISQETYDAKIEEAKLKDKELELKGRGDNVAPSGEAIPSGQDAAGKHPACGGGRPCFEQVVHPSFVTGWKMLMGQIFENNAEFTQELMKCNNCVTSALKTGDWMSPCISEMLDLTSKATVKRHLGDCSRLWSQVRRLRLFGPENTNADIPAGSLHDKNILGGPLNSVTNENPPACDRAQALHDLYNEEKEWQIVKYDEQTRITLYRNTNDGKFIVHVPANGLFPDDTTGKFYEVPAGKTPDEIINQYKEDLPF